MEAVEAAATAASAEAGREVDEGEWSPIVPPTAASALSLPLPRAHVNINQYEPCAFDGGRRRRRRRSQRRRRREAGSYRESWSPSPSPRPRPRPRPPGADFRFPPASIGHVVRTTARVVLQCRWLVWRVVCSMSQSHTPRFRLKVRARYSGAIRVPPFPPFGLLGAAPARCSLAALLSGCGFLPCTLALFSSATALLLLTRLPPRSSIPTGGEGEGGEGSLLPTATAAATTLRVAAYPRRPLPSHAIFPPPRGKFGAWLNCYYCTREKKKWRRRRRRPPLKCPSPRATQ